MGNTYLIYTEMMIDGKWRCIDGYYYHKPYGKNKERLRLMTTYENGSRSYFGETYQELKSIGDMIKFSDLSKEIQDEHPGLRYEYNIYGEENKDKEAYYVVVGYDDFNRKVPKNYSNHAIIHKDRIAAYENSEIDEIWQDEDIDYGKLSDLEKQCYQYYEWDSKWGWQYYFKHLKELVDFTINKYLINEFLFEEHKVRLVVFKL